MEDPQRYEEGLSPEQYEPQEFEGEQQYLEEGDYDEEYVEELDQRVFQAELLESKRKRNQADEDAMKLRNRIKMLEMEERRAQKKLKKTKQKKWR